MRQERNKKSNRRDQLDRFELFCKCAQMIHTCVFSRKVATGRETERKRQKFIHSVGAQRHSQAESFDRFSCN